LDPIPSGSADLVVAPAVRDEADHIVLACGEVSSPGGARSDREGEATRGDPPDRVDQFGEWRGLEHEPGGAKAKRGLGVLRVVIRRQHDDRRERAGGPIIAPDVGEQPQPAVGAEADVDEEDVHVRGIGQAGRPGSLDRARHPHDREALLAP